VFLFRHIDVCAMGAVEAAYPTEKIAPQAELLLFATLVTVFIILKIHNHQRAKRNTL